MVLNRSALPQGFYPKQPQLLEDFSDIASWLVTGGSATLSVDNINYYTGTKSVTMTTQAGVNATIDKTINVQFRDGKIYVKFYCITDPATTINSILFYFGSVAWSKYFNSIFSASSMVQGWNYLTITPPNTVYTGGENWGSAFVKMRVALWPLAGQIASVSFDAIYYDGVGIPKVLFTFDDGWLTAHQNAFPYMQSKGVKGTMYTIPKFLRDSGDPLANALYMSQAEIRQWHDAGFLIANHTINHAYYLTQNYTVSDYKDKVRQCIDWLNANGYSDGAYHIAYPRGEYDAGVIQAMKDLGMKTGRSVRNGQQHTYHAVDDYFQLTIRSMGSVVDISTAKSYVDAAILMGVTCIFMFHQIPVDDTANTVDAQPSLAFSQSKFQQLVDYVVERKVDTPTMDEWYQGITNPRFRGVPLLRV